MQELKNLLYCPVITPSCAPNNLLVVKIQILAIFIHSWANEYKLFSRLKCPIFQRELINFLFPRAPLAQLSLIGTPGERAPEAQKWTQGPEGRLIGNSTVISLTSSTVVNLRNTNHTPTTSHDKSNLLPVGQFASNCHRSGRVRHLAPLVLLHHLVVEHLL